jgi:hypothetical protein
MIDCAPTPLIPTIKQAATTIQRSWRRYCQKTGKPLAAKSTTATTTLPQMATFGVYSVSAMLWQQPNSNATLQEILSKSGEYRRMRRQKRDIVPVSQIKCQHKPRRQLMAVPGDLKRPTVTPPTASAPPRPAWDSTVVLPPVRSVRAIVAQSHNHPAPPQSVKVPPLRSQKIPAVQVQRDVTAKSDFPLPLAVYTAVVNA